MLKQAVLVALFALGCAGDNEELNETESRTTGSGSGSGSSSGSGSGTQTSGEACDMTPIDDEGTLRACALRQDESTGAWFVGTSSIQSRPYVGTAEEKAAAAAANRLWRTRNPAVKLSEALGLPQETP